jgi:hypothetical protein
MFTMEPDKPKCIRCGQEIDPGLMNAAKHWTVCPKNPNILKSLVTKTPLIEAIKRTSKLPKS